MDDLPLARLRWNSLLGKQRQSKISIDASGTERKLEGWGIVTKEWDI